jgi:hypothetical protein
MTHFEASGLDAEAVELIENDLTATLALEPFMPRPIHKSKRSRPFRRW